MSASVYASVSASVYASVSESAPVSAWRRIIHRDLNSPNLVLACASSSGGELLVKVTDFGLSKDKGLDEAKHTVLMTGCGSILWMAPEIMHAEQCDTHTSHLTRVRQTDAIYVHRQMQIQV